MVQVINCSRSWAIFATEPTEDAERCVFAHNISELFVVVLKVFFRVVPWIPWLISFL